MKPILKNDFFPVIAGIGSRRRGGSVFSFASTDGTGDGETQEYTIRMPVGKSMTIDWGDGNSDTYNGAGNTDINPSHTYAEAGSYDIKFKGDYLSLTELLCDSNSLEGDVSGWSALTNLTHLYCRSNNLSGDVSGWSALTNLTELLCRSNNLSGDVSGWSALTKLTHLYCNSNNLEGDVSGWSALTNLNYFICDRNSLEGDVSGWSALTKLIDLRCALNNLSGDVSSWSALTKLTLLYCYSNNLDFDNQTNWAALELGTACQWQDNSMTSTQVDNALISFANGPFTDTTIDLSGNNAPRTSASDSAVSTLEANGCTIITTAA